MDPMAASKVKNTLAKTVFSALRDFVIERINCEIRTENWSKYIGILDMPGFGKFHLYNR